MSLSLDKLNIREKGGHVPLSIGTALAIESSFGFDAPDGKPRLTTGQEAPILKVDALWINLRTLFRNILHSLATEDRAVVMPDDIVTVMQEEMRILESAVTRFTKGRVLVVFYVCTYAGLGRRYPRALLKEAKTDKQKSEQAIERHVMTHYMSSDDGHDVRRFDVDLEAGAPRTLLLTHLPVDLLSRSHFVELELLESHTGKIKKRGEWSSKLTGKELNRIPFNSFTIQLFGDGVMFASMSFKLKEMIVNLANEDKWTTITTQEKMRYSLTTLYDPKVKTFFLTLLSR